MSATHLRVQDVDTGVIYDAICSNCDGRKCMSCVLRDMHDACEDDCPACCDVPGIDMGGPLYRLFPALICGLCGNDPAHGWAKINDVPYCHGDDDIEPTCYMRASSAVVS